MDLKAREGQEIIKKVMIQSGSCACTNCFHWRFSWPQTVMFFCIITCLEAWNTLDWDTRTLHPSTPPSSTAPSPDLAKQAHTQIGVAMMSSPLELPV